jgi:hypothetical protein
MVTPFAYHSLAVQSGTATLPELIGDRALAFALAGTLGYLRARVALPDKNYRRDLVAMPWRTSVLMADQPRLLAPLVRRLNLEDEGGYQEKIREVTYKGKLKQFFLIQEVPPGVLFRGAVFGFDPFAAAGQDELVVRLGLHRNGMVRVRPDPSVRSVRLNAATASLFGRELLVDRFLLYGLQLTSPMTLNDAATEVAQWN